MASLASRCCVLLFLLLTQPQRLDAGRVELSGEVADKKSSGETVYIVGNLPIDVNGDGNCMFYSVLAAMGRLNANEAAASDGKWHKTALNKVGKMRKQVSRFLKSDPSFLSPEEVADALLSLVGTETPKMAQDMLQANERNQHKKPPQMSNEDWKAKRHAKLVDLYAKAIRGQAWGSHETLKAIAASYKMEIQVFIDDAEANRYVRVPQLYLPLDPATSTKTIYLYNSGNHYNYFANLQSDNFVVEHWDTQAAGYRAEAAELTCGGTYYKQWALVEAMGFLGKKEECRDDFLACGCAINIFMEEFSACLWD